MDIGAIPFDENAFLKHSLRIGENIRHFRKKQGLSLSQLGLTSNVSKSNISKIENGIISPTFEMMERISSGLQIPTSSLLSNNVQNIGKKFFSNANSGPRSLDGHYEFEFLFSDFASRRMVPFVTTVTGSGFDDLKPPAQHRGEEFFYVLDGAVDFIGSQKQATTMNVGDSVYFDSNEEHLVINRAAGPSKVLWVWLE